MSTETDTAATADSTSHSEAVSPQREEILSREETDALLQGIDDGSVATGAGQDSTGEVILYDFAECDRLTRGAMPTLQIINTRIARNLRDSLSEFLRQPVTVEAGENFARRFGDHIPTLPMPACLNLIRIPPLPGTMLVVPETGLIQIIVDYFFGGNGNISGQSQDRELTQVEMRMVSLLLERVIEAIGDSWEPVIALEPELIGQEQDPQFAAIASAREAVIVTEYSIRLADKEFELQMIIPRAALEPVEEVLDNAPRNDTGDDSQWLAALGDRLEETQIGLHSTLTQTTLRLGDVLSLQPGDVIRVDLPEQVVLEAAGTPVFDARIGASRNRNAVEIIAPTGSNPPANQN